MPLPKRLSKSPYEINKPENRWQPDIENSKKGIQFFSAPFINKVRKELYEWRQFGYDGISDTSRFLLNYWFYEEHNNGFQYYFGQRESVESVIFLYEKVGVRDNKDLLKLDSWGINEEFINDDWLRFVLKQATGTGKTKVLALLIAWSYFQKEYESNSSLSKNFLLIAPNTIVLDRLKTDFCDLKIFNNDPVIPYSGFEGRSWNFNCKVHIQDEIRHISDEGNIFLTNVQRFANRASINSEYDLKNKFLGAEPVKGRNDNKLKIKDIVKNIEDLLILNDEAHHVYEDTAWKRAIEDINNSLKQKGKKLPLQIDVTATPKTKKGKISYGPAIQLLNIDQIVDLCEFFEETSPGNNGIGGYYSHVKYPVICDYDIAPPEYKLKVADKLERQIKDLNTPSYINEISTHIDALRREVFTEDQRNTYLNMFIRFNDAQDKFRKNTKTWRELLPDLESAIKL